MIKLKDNEKFTATLRGLVITEEEIKEYVRQNDYERLGIAKYQMQFDEEKIISMVQTKEYDELKNGFFDCLESNTLQDAIDYVGLDDNVKECFIEFDLFEEVVGKYKDFSSLNIKGQIQAVHNIFMDNGLEILEENVLRQYVTEISLKLGYEADKILGYKPSSIEELRNKYAEEKEVHGLKTQTQFNGLNRIMRGGLPKGKIIYLGAESNVGKTLFTLQLMIHQAKQGKKVGIFNTDMSEFDLVFNYIMPLIGNEEETYELLATNLLILPTANNLGRLITIEGLPNLIDGLDLNYLVVDLINSAPSALYNEEYQKLEHIANVFKRIRDTTDITVIGITVLNKRDSKVRNTAPSFYDIKGNSNVLHAIDSAWLMYSGGEVESEGNGWEEAKTGKVVKFFIDKTRIDEDKNVEVEFILTKTEGFIEKGNGDSIDF